MTMDNLDAIRFRDLSYDIHTKCDQLMSLIQQSKVDNGLETNLELSHARMVSFNRHVLDLFFKDFPELDYRDQF